MVRSESASLTFNCENKNCSNNFSATIVEHRGGVNDYGWWAIKCDKCDEIFIKYIGRDVSDSRLNDGGKIIKRYDKGVYSEDEVLADLDTLRSDS